MDAVADRPVTVNVAAVVALAIFAFDTVHVPKVPVLQLAVPPVLHVPDAVTPLTGPCVALSTRIVTFAVHVVVWRVREPSRSPTGSSTGGVTVTVTVTAGLWSDPSDVRYVNVSTPLNPDAGVYLTFELSEYGGRSVTHRTLDGVVSVPCAGWLTIWKPRSQGSQIGRGAGR